MDPSLIIILNFGHRMLASFNIGSKTQSLKRLTEQVSWIIIYLDMSLIYLRARNFSPGENFCQFCQFCHQLSLVKYYSANFLSRVNEYVEHMATFTILVKFIPLNISVFLEYKGSWA